MLQSEHTPRVVLLVDDDPDIALVCSLHLTSAGLTVLEAADGSTALELAREHIPDVIVLDYMLPDLNGLEVLRRLKADPVTAELPVVMLTARTHERDQLLAWEAGVSDFLTKPFAGAKLVAAVSSAADRLDPWVTSRKKTAVQELAGVDHRGASLQAAFFRDAADAMVICAPGGNVIAWNAAAAAMFGWDEDEVVGSPLSVIVPPEGIAALEQLIADAVSGKASGVLDCAGLRRDGSRMVLSLRMAPVSDSGGAVMGASLVLRDITTRVQSESRIELLVDAAPDAMVIVNADGRIELVNKQTENLFGYRREDLVGQLIEVLVPEQFRDRHPEHRRAYTSRPRIREMGAGLDLLGLRADGSVFPVEISLSPLGTGEGASYAATVRDVSERKAVEARFRGVLEAAPDAIVGFDRQGCIVLVNAAVESLFGYHREDLIGRQVGLLLPEGVDLSEHAEGDADGEAVVGLQREGRRADGTSFPAELSVSRVVTSGETLLCAAIRDVTENRRAEERFRSLVEAAPDAMVIVGQDGRIELINAQTVQLFGYDREELVGQYVEVLIPERFQQGHPTRREGYASQPKVRPMGAGLDLHGRRKDGSEFPIEISLSPIVSDSGVTVCAAIRDVTERREIEAAQALAFEREREASARLREVDRLRTDFLSTVSHELRTPLTAIRGFAEWLVGAWEDTPDSTKLDMVERMLHAGSRLDFLIQDLLDFSRLERGQLQVTMQRQALSPIVRKTLGNVTAAMSGHELQLDLDESAVVDVDASAMMRVVENLLTNAAKFSLPGSSIWVRTWVAEDGVHMSVRDEGVGISEADRHKVFDRFYRVPETATQAPGTGIGLAIVKQFVEAQGGRVTLVDGVGQGAEFELVLPSPADD